MWVVRVLVRVQACMHAGMACVRACMLMRMQTPASIQAPALH